MKKIYVVQYSTGAYESFEKVMVFATESEEIAIKYIDKFNTILKKWQEYYAQFFNSDDDSSDQLRKYYQRWDSINDVNKAFYEEIEIR